MLRWWRAGFEGAIRRGGVRVATRTKKLRRGGVLGAVWARFRAAFQAKMGKHLRACPRGAREVVGMVAGCLRAVPTVYRRVAGPARARAQPPKVPSHAIPLPAQGAAATQKTCGPALRDQGASPEPFSAQFQQASTEIGTPTSRLPSK
jgi:hypothetical protein